MISAMGGCVLFCNLFGKNHAAFLRNFVRFCFMAKF